VLRRRPFLTALLAPLALAGGCTSNDVAIRLLSEPEGATVYVDGERVGMSGDLFHLRYGSDPLQQICIQLRKADYKPVEASWDLTEIPPEGRDGTRQWIFRLEQIQ
jgi:hypothetical protein